MFNKDVFTNRESVTKSLSLEMIPQGRTLENIKENGVFEFEQEIADAAETLKGMYDRFYRSLTTDIIGCAELPMEDYYKAFLSKKEDAKAYADMMMEVFNAFVKHTDKYIVNTYKKFSRIVDGTFFKEIFPEYAKMNLTIEELKLYEKCRDVVVGSDVYFKSYQENREKLYGGAEHGTIAARTILENMPVYFENMVIWENVKDKINVSEVDDSIFCLDYVMDYMTYIGIEHYNKTIGELNQIINIHNQQNDDNVKSFRNKLKVQILSVRSKETIKAITNDKEVAELITDSCEHLANTEIVDNVIMLLLDAVGNRDLEQIYIGGNSLSYISNLLTGKWDMYKENLKEAGISLKAPYYSLAQLSQCYPDEDTFAKALERILYEYAARYKTAISNMRKALNKQNFRLNAEIEFVQEYFDCITELRRFVKRFAPNDMSDLEYDAVFYENLYAIIEDLDEVAYMQSRVKSYATKAPKDMTKKVRHCLGNPAIYSAGWNISDKEKRVIAPGEQSLLMKDGKYYYLKPASGQRIPLSDIPVEGAYEKISIMQSVNAYQSLPKWIFSKDIKEKLNAGEAFVTRNDTEEPFTVTKEEFDRYSAGLFKTDKDALVEWIDLCKRFMKVNKNFTRFGIDVDAMRPSNEYTNSNEFYTEVDAMTYRLYKQYIDAELLDNMVEEGNAYLFLLSARNMYRDNCNNDYANIFMYILSDENMNSGLVRLASTTEITHRRACKERKVTHEKGSYLVNRYTLMGERIPDAIYKEIYNYHNKKSTTIGAAASTYMDEHIVDIKPADRDLIKDRRYTEDKWFISICYKLNPTPEKKGKINDVAREEFNIDNNPNILTVIRGEKDLLYYTLTGLNVNEKGSLNVINGVDYGTLITNFGRERQNAQKDWNYTKKIANYKDSYIGQAVSWIVKKAIETNAIICIEELSKGFKEKRKCIDNNVYEKFEKMLVNRLSCFTDVHIPMGEPGSLVKPLQLASARLDKARQNGILFKVNNARTAMVDEENGFTNMFAFGNVSTVSGMKSFLSKMREISVSKAGDVIIRFNYADFNAHELASDCKNMDKEWTIVATGMRNIKNSMGFMEMVKISDEWRNLLESLESDNTGSKVAAIITDSSITRKAMDLLKATLLSKYVNSDGEEKYISPVSGRTEGYSEHAANMLERKLKMFYLDGKPFVSSEWFESLFA